KHDEQASPTLEWYRTLGNKSLSDPLKTKSYFDFPSFSPYFKPTEPLTTNTYEPLEENPDEYDSHHEDEELSSEEDLDDWLSTETGKCMNGQDKEEEEDALIDILKTMVSECKLIYKNTQTKTPSSRTSEVQGVSFITEDEEGDNHLKLADLKETNMAVEMGDMTEKALVGIMENVQVKIDKFLFYLDFIVMDTVDELNEIMLLGGPFLATIHDQIDVFKKEISLEVGEEVVKFNIEGKIYHSKEPLEKIYMETSIQEEEYFNPLEIKNDVFSYESPTCLSFKQSNHSNEIKSEVKSPLEEKEASQCMFANLFV
ncbi:copia protein, partial [Tanacetum coccineum]